MNLFKFFFEPGVVAHTLMPVLGRQMDLSALEVNLVHIINFKTARVIL